MNENEDQVLVALLTVARGVYDCERRFHLTRAEVLALVRGLLDARPSLTVAELVQLAGERGVPTFLVRAGRGEPPSMPVPKPTAWSRRTRLSGGILGR